MKQTMKGLLILPLLIVLLTLPAQAVHLQDVYDQAGPGQGYDKLLILDPGQVYTGYLIAMDGVRCGIRGNGALITLDAGGTISAYTGVTLDVDGCIITGGDVGLGYADCPDSRVTNCTLTGNTMGLAVSNSIVSITNCIIVDNRQYGVCWMTGPRPTQTYNNAWSNGELNYATFCDG
jgi:hypothetical protein